MNFGSVSPIRKLLFQRGQYPLRTGSVWAVSLPPVDINHPLANSV